MKDRIHKIMESLHMTQQVFAEFIGTTSATLSGIFNERNRPSLNVVELIKKKIPDINSEWLIFGNGPMYLNDQHDAVGAIGGSDEEQKSGVEVVEPMIDFGSPSVPTPSTAYQQPRAANGVRNTPQQVVREEIKIIDKPQRRVTEIRVYYDDQTWESFVPSKK